ncbi:MAG: ABC transporter [Actinobacteria bacterium]|nr:MAG: ABC transporter [Actinomycetota bacterium]
MNTAAPPAPAAFHVDTLVKTFKVGRHNTITALDNVSLSIGRGEIVALLGENGAGKTTMIDIALGLQQPDSGNATLFDMKPREAIRRSLVGVVHQTGALMPEYTVKQILSVFHATHPNALPIQQVLEATDLATHAKKKISKLSGGEQQRVRLALALLPNPELLILDEPTAGMDALARRAFWDLMHTQSEQGRTIIFATHYLAEAQDFAQRTVIIKNGTIITDAPTDEVRRIAASFALRIALDLHAIPAARHEDALRALPDGHTWTISWDSEVLNIKGTQLDDAARYLLNQPGARGLELTASTLEDAFASLSA